MLIKVFATFPVFSFNFFLFIISFDYLDDVLNSWNQVLNDLFGLYLLHAKTDVISFLNPFQAFFKLLIFYFCLQDLPEVLSHIWYILLFYFHSRNFFRLRTIDALLKVVRYSIGTHTSKRLIEIDNIRSLARVVKVESLLGWESFVGWYKAYTRFIFVIIEIIHIKNFYFSALFQWFESLFLFLTFFNFVIKFYII